MSGDRSRMRVVDYKTGSRAGSFVLRGGRELQRCLYAFAVRSLLGENVEIEAGLLYPSREPSNPAAGNYDALPEPGETVTGFSPEASISSKTLALAGMSRCSSCTRTISFCNRSGNDRKSPCTQALAAFRHESSVARIVSMWRRMSLSKFGPNWSRKIGSALEAAPAPAGQRSNFGFRARGCRPACPSPKSAWRRAGPAPCRC